MLKGKLFDGGFLFLMVLVVFGYGVSLLERGQDPAGVVQASIVEDVVKDDVEYVKEKASVYYAESKVNYPDGYNQEWYNTNVND